MKKERVIIFEGEHQFVAPKNRVRNKKTGVSYHVESEVNLVDDAAPSYRQTAQAQQDRLALVQPTQADPIVATSKLVGAGTGVIIDPGPAQGGNINESTTTTSSTTSTTTIAVVIKLEEPLGLGKAPLLGGGGGGGRKEEGAAKKVTTLQKYWWLIPVVAIGGYFTYKKLKK